ncbi:hypothetical protein [Methylobacterium ajmalii]|jgi:hypothetical protein|uniref:hypothetical protein n=1 Tax=Methylobacterium ajmalii TaxID=2738439 RepID=UPI00190B51C5|nr:hypothetical protein [Methylobacterium ajmalii]MBK3400049.1 hypothetical protein [Methylobacterium ajmalii]MBK3411345.1 hypothetical protein [Methylobacterium ajmalii]MBK3426708.1 hypothetical protein [Methylobacterium ajmalii]
MWRFLQGAVLGVALFASAPAFAQTQRDSDALTGNPAVSIYQGKVTYPDYKRSAKRFNFVRTGINNGISAGPNFAGKYAIVVLGCGASCAIGYLSDVSNGHVSELPFSGEDFPNPVFFYNVRSTALVVYWQPDDRCMRQVAVLDADSFKLSKPEDVGGREVCEAVNK